MQIEPLERPTTSDMAAAAGAAPRVRPTDAASPQAPRHLETLLQSATGDLERALQLVTAPPRPSFMGHGPVKTASALMASASAHLTEAMGIATKPGIAPNPDAVVRHLAHAVGASVDATDLFHQMLAPGSVAPAPSTLQATAVLIEDALAHARMALAACIGEP